MDTDIEAARIMGAKLIRQFEGCTLAPKPDTSPRWQIGYGCNYLPDGTPVSAATPALKDIDAAEALLQAELEPMADDVDAMIDVPLTVGQRSAVYSFSWNEGPGALAGSTLLRLLNSSDMSGAAEQFAAWIYAGGRPDAGLVRRRAVERAVFLGLTTP